MVAIGGILVCAQTIAKKKKRHEFDKKQDLTVILSVQNQFIYRLLISPSHTASHPRNFHDTSPIAHLLHANASCDVHSCPVPDPACRVKGITACYKKKDVKNNRNRATLIMKHILKTNQISKISFLVECLFCLTGYLPLSSRPIGLLQGPYQYLRRAVEPHHAMQN